MKHKVSYVLIDEIRHKLGYIASNFYEWPQRKLKIIGVTGTNGKTSSTYMIEKLMGDTPITRIGTIEYKIGDEVFEAKIQSLGTIFSSSLKISFLISIFSSATSTTRSQSVQILLSPTFIFEIILSPASFVIFSLPTRKLISIP